MVNITIPVFNEEQQLADHVLKLHSFLTARRFHDFELVVAENGSTDRTGKIADELAAAYPQVFAVHLELPGRGRAIKTVWRNSQAALLSYMDVDLSADLDAFPAMIASLESSSCDIVVGSRLLNRETTKRSLKREIMSRGYNALIKALFRTKFSDSQCGFKAITSAAARRLIPLLEDEGWFMDTELLVIAEKLGYRILDQPVTWVDDPDTRVRLWSTVAHDIRGLIRLRRNLPAILNRAYHEAA